MECLHLVSTWEKALFAELIDRLVPVVGGDDASFRFGSSCEIGINSDTTFFSPSHFQQGRRPP